MTANRLQSRRDFIGAAAAAGFAGALPLRAAAEPPPETERIRILKLPSVCQAPAYVAEELLRAEGFTEVSYIDLGVKGLGAQGMQVLSDGQIDITTHFAASLALAIDRGAEVSVLGGVHVGCFELVTGPGVRTIRDLKGKTISGLTQESPPHVYLASIVASVGLDPNRDIHWVFHPGVQSKALLAEGKIDGFLAFPPESQELLDRKIGRVLVNSTVDRPWSQYFCCMVAANRPWVHRHPVAAKRALRAFLKASDLCASDPELGVKAYLANGFTPKVEYARQALRELPYGRWRDFNAEESLRFYALRLREAGMIKGAPQKIITEGTDWRLFEQLKRELKT